MERLPKGVYSPEFRAEAVKLVEQTGMSIDRAAKQLSIPKSSLSNWGRAAKKGQLAAVDQGQRAPNEQEVELARLPRELAEVKQERDLLKICGVFREGVAVRYDREDGLRPQYPVAMLCRWLNVSEAGYYAWRRWSPSPCSQENARLAIEGPRTDADLWARTGCRQNWLITVFMLALIALNGCAASWGCVVGRNGNSR